MVYLSPLLCTHITVNFYDFSSSFYYRHSTEVVTYKKRLYKIVMMQKLLILLVGLIKKFGKSVEMIMDDGVTVTNQLKKITNFTQNKFFLHQKPNLSV